ncbi:MAG TPA: hypothetical protein VF756_00280 [Thermoanaerobaculia bacterium]
MLDHLDLPPHVRDALDQGKLWRAKEILQGRIGSQTYDPLLYEAYGAVLLEMQDLLQAGKYLFLSGSRRPEYAQAIALFLDRHGRRGGGVLISGFPNRAKALPLDRLPEPVRRELLARGVSPKATRKSLASPTAPPPTKAARYLSLIGCTLVVLFLAASTMAGVPVITRWVSELIRALLAR